MTNGVTITLAPSVLRRLEDVIDRSELGSWLEDELEAATQRGAGTHAGGRRRVLTAHALLVGMLATTWAGQPLILRTVVGGPQRSAPLGQAPPGCPVHDRGRGDRAARVLPVRAHHHPGGPLAALRGQP